MNIFLLFLSANFLSLAWVTKVHRKGLGLLLKNPAFLIGDFFLIPLYFSLTARYLNVGFSAVLAIIAIVIVVIFGRVFNLLRWEWVPHGMIACLVVYTYFSGILFSFETGDYYLLVVSSLILLAHEILGAIFSKKM